MITNDNNNNIEERDDEQQSSDDKLYGESSEDGDYNSAISSNSESAYEEREEKYSDEEEHSFEENEDEMQEHYIEDDQILGDPAKWEYFPFPNLESALLYTWCNLNPRISTRKMKLLLEILHTPEFKVTNLPKSLYFFDHMRSKMPTIQLRKITMLLCCFVLPI